ncbi:MAG: DUF4124 domain-containing protein [Nitrospiraceae bacterium]|nr:DUF4124 domain-containing protein [Nitrospiraceae bacterium]
MMIGNLAKAVDGREDGGYSEIMNGDDRHARSFVGSLLLVGALCAPPSVSANDYYSWIDANGTMVMTDDASRVPPSAGRSQIQVHRFEPVAPSPTVAHEPESASREELLQIAAVDPHDLNLPLVVLGEPESQVRAQYVWVPLLSPLFVGGNSVSGFWWYPGATSPVEAFKQYLAQHSRQQQAQWAPGIGVPYPYPSHRGMVQGPSGNSVYDQVTRERQALEESIRLRHFPASAGPTPQISRGGGGRHSIRSR